MAFTGKRAGLIAAAALSLLLSGPAEAAPPPSVTLPFALDHNRMIVEVAFRRPDGSPRKAMAWVDTGSPNLMVAESLARDLGLERTAPEEGRLQRSVDSASRVPALYIGGMRLETGSLKVSISRGERVMPGLPAEAILPASALRGLHVVLDYPAQRLTLAAPGLLKPRGTPLPCRINAETGLFCVTATLDGQEVQLGVDTGSAGTWISESLTTAWAARHPDWPRSSGAAGSANFFGFSLESKGTLMRLPEFLIGPLKAWNIAVLGLDPGLFDWYSQKSAGAVLGFIGANVLKGFRLEIDSPGQMTYWEAGETKGAEDLDIVGLTLRPETDGRMTLAGLVQKDGRPWVEGLQAGDALLQVDGLKVQDATMGAVVDALRGRPGAVRRLRIEREGKPFTLEAKVARLP